MSCRGWGFVGARQPIAHALGQHDPGPPSKLMSSTSDMTTSPSPWTACAVPIDIMRRSRALGRNKLVRLQSWFHACSAEYVRRTARHPPISAAARRPMTSPRTAFSATTCRERIRSPSWRLDEKHAVPCKGKSSGRSRGLPGTHGRDRQARDRSPDSYIPRRPLLGALAPQSDRRFDRSARPRRVRLQRAGKSSRIFS